MTAGSFHTFLLTSPRPQGDRLCVCPQDTPFTDLTGGCKDSQVTWCAFACQTPELGGVTWRQRRHQPPVWVRAAGGAGPVPEAVPPTWGQPVPFGVGFRSSVCLHEQHVSLDARARGWQPCVSLRSPEQLLLSLVTALVTQTAI